MTQITQKARHFTYDVLCHYGILQGHNERADALPYISLLLRHAKSYQHVQEAICNGHPACSSASLPINTVRRLQARHEEWCEKRDRQLSRRIKEVAEHIPGVDLVKLGGDPRGVTVKLLLASGRGDSWETVGDDINTEEPDPRRYVCLPC